MGLCLVTRGKGKNLLTPDARRKGSKKYELFYDFHMFFDQNNELLYDCHMFFFFYQNNELLYDFYMFFDQNNEFFH